MTSEESSELVRLAETKKVVAGVCFNYRHYPLVAQVKELMASDEYGPAHLVYGTYLQDWLLYDTDYNWRLNEEKTADHVRLLTSVPIGVILFNMFSIKRLSRYLLI